MTSPPLRTRCWEVPGEPVVLVRMEGFLVHGFSGPTLVHKRRHYFADFSRR
jgi:hypothetical protein